MNEPSGQATPTVKDVLLHAPHQRGGFPSFAIELAEQNTDFPADLFPALAAAENKSFWFQGRNRVIQWLFGRFLGSRRNDVLEIGCGTGFVLRGLADLFPNYQLTGAEIYTEGLRFAQERTPEANFCQLDALQLPFFGLFDAVGCFDVLEHIADDRKVLTEILHALRPGGFLILTVPQHPWLWSEFDEAGNHKRRYKRSELIEKTKSAGFEVLYVSSFVTLLLPLLFLNRCQQRKTRRTSDEISRQAIRDISPNIFINLIGSLCMGIDVVLMRLGISLLWGGSLALVARKAAHTSLDQKEASISFNAKSLTKSA